MGRKLRETAKHLKGGLKEQAPVRGTSELEAQTSDFEHQMTGLGLAFPKPTLEAKRCDGMADGRVAKFLVGSLESVVCIDKDVVGPDGSHHGGVFSGATAC